MINNDVVPFPSSFLCFRHTGTDIYDVKNETPMYDVKKLDFRIKKSFLRYPFLFAAKNFNIRFFDRHHDTNSDTSIIASIIAFLLRMVVLGSWSSILIMEGYETLVVDTCIMKHDASIHVPKITSRSNNY